MSQPGEWTLVVGGLPAHHRRDPRGGSRRLHAPRSDVSPAGIVSIAEGPRRMPGSPPPALSPDARDHCEGRSQAAVAGARRARHAAIRNTSSRQRRTSPATGARDSAAPQRSALALRWPEKAPFHLCRASCEGSAQARPSARLAGDPLGARGFRRRAAHGQLKGRTSTDVHGRWRNLGIPWVPTGRTSSDVGVRPRTSSGPGCGPRGCGA